MERGYPANIKENIAGKRKREYECKGERKEERQIIASYL